MEATMNRATRGRSIGGGIFAGIVAGIVMFLYLVGTTAYHGGDIWQVMKGAGLPLLGERAAQPGFDLTAILVGVGVHMGVSIIWALLFAILFFGASRFGTFALGAAWGIVVWLVMYYLVLPIAGLGFMSKSVPLGQAVLMHVVYGLIVGIAFLPYQRPRGAREPRLVERLGEPR